VFFDNVGGDVLNAMLPLMAHRGRIVCCGAIAHYDEKDDGLVRPGPPGIPQYLINRGLRLEGFTIADFVSDWPEALRQLSTWLAEGAIKNATHIWEGLESAPAALISVLSGDNFGQALVRVSSDSGP
jgi:NADPH-dependent curcumin reductase CurA